jgi:hypothetical protein
MSNGAGRLSWWPLSFEHVVLALVLIGQNFLVNFKLLNQALDILHADLTIRRAVRLGPWLTSYLLGFSDFAVSIQ